MTARTTKQRCTITERGWPGHFICSPSCLFRRNTLIECGRTRIVISTVGSYRTNHAAGGIDTIGAFGRYYETMAFSAVKEDAYWEADVDKQVLFNSPWSISAESADQLPADVDTQADDMHMRVVHELVTKLEAEK